MTDLIERLRATRERALWTQIEGFDPVRQKVSTLINPDGPEAVAEIEKLRLENLDRLIAHNEANKKWEAELTRLRAELDQYKEAVRLADDFIDNVLIYIDVDTDYWLKGGETNYRDFRQGMKGEANEAT